MSSDDEDYNTQQSRHLLKEMVKAILLLDQSKKPFKQTDIYACMTEKPARKLSRTLINDAIKSLREMGMNLVEAESTSNKSFILVSYTRPLPFVSKYASTEEQADRLLLVIVLAFIFMKEGSVSEEALLQHLEKLNIHEENHAHDLFGSVKKKVFTEFVEQLYLKVKKSSGADGNEVVWGQRAEVEVNKMDILEFVCQYGYKNKVKPESFVSHYQKIRKEMESRSDRVNQTNSPEEEDE